MFSTRPRSVLAMIALAVTATLALGGCTAGAAAPATYDPKEKVTISLAWWGNDDRSSKYTEALKAFKTEYPNITVETSFMEFPAFWEKRKTEAAGGGLPDVMQFDWSYVAEFGANGLLLPLNKYYGKEIDTSSIAKNILSTGKVGDDYVAIPISTNSWTLFQNDRQLKELGVTPYAGGGTWADYDKYLAEVRDASKGTVWGGSDYTGRIQFFELWLRQQGKNLFKNGNEVAFTKADLTKFWNMGQKLQKEKLFVPAQTLEEVLPKSGISAKFATSEFSWDNFLAGYLADSGETNMSFVAPPALAGSSKDLYMKPAMLHAISAKTKHPEASALLVNFLINSPATGEIFGASRGIPVSSAPRSKLTGADAAVVAYQDSVAARIGTAPIPPAGFGSIEQKYLDLSKSLGLGAISVNDAVSQFFDELNVIL